MKKYEIVGKETWDTLTRQTLVYVVKDLKSKKLIYVTESSLNNYR